MAAPTVGLTGGIACGKSTVARLFAELGVPVVDADRVAREIVRKGTGGYREVVAAFGAEILGDDGEIDRGKLGTLVFGNAALRGKLNAITHPRIAEESATQIATLSESGVPYVLYEAALLVENGIDKLLPALVVVTAPEATQVARIVSRDRVSEADARARIAAQMPNAEKAKAATHVIENVGAIHELRERVREVHGALVAQFARS